MVEKTKMTSVDLGMFGLDCFVTDKSSSSLDSDLCIEEFESLLQDSPISSQNILDMSLQQSGIADIETNNNNIGEQMEVGGAPSSSVLTLILFSNQNTSFIYNTLTKVSSSILLVISVLNC